jgi:hypothetical protein
MAKIQTARVTRITIYLFQNGSSVSVRSKLGTAIHTETIDLGQDKFSPGVVSQAAAKSARALGFMQGDVNLPPLP